MKCRVCGRDAVVKLDYANLKLCREHFIEFFERRVARTISRYGMLRRGDKVAVAVSGGKDSASLLHALWRLKGELGVELVGVTIDLGIRGYSDQSVEVARRNYEKLGVPYRIIKLADYGFIMDDARTLKKPACSTCGAVKRYLLNKAAREIGATVIVTGHTLDDFLAVLMQAYTRGDLQQLAKHRVYLPPADGLIARAKPLVETPERESLLYAQLLGLEFTVIECPLSRGATLADFKAALNLLEERHPGMKIMMLRAFLNRLQPLLPSERRVPGRCEVCGEPSTSSVCQFCRIRSRLTQLRATCNRP